MAAGATAADHEIALNYRTSLRHRSGMSGTMELHLGLVAYLADNYTAEAVRFGYTF
jgi:hypothetical protein